MSPQRARLKFYFELLPDNTNATAKHIVAFLHRLKTQIGAFTAIGDGSYIHSRAGVVQAYLARHAQVVAGTLPGYAPELNPVEGMWGSTKYGRLANLAAAHTLELRERVEG